MSKKPNLALPLLLLSCTTIAIGGIIYGLLWKEAERLRRAALASANQQAATIVENIGLTVSEIKTAMMQALIQFQGPEFEPQLDTWQQEDPFVNFSFIWRREDPYTVSTFPESENDRDSLESLLRDEDQTWLWQLAPKAERELTFADNSYEEAEARDEGALASNYAANDSVRKTIRSQSQLSTRLAQAPSRSREEWVTSSTKWIHRKTENSSYWIGFSSWNNGAVFTGATLDLTQLGDILQQSFPAAFVSTINYLEIRDANNRPVTSTGTTSSSYDRSNLGLQKSAFTIPIGADLPGWTLYMRTNIDGSLSGALLSPAGIATAVVLLILFAAGLWLAYQSRTSQIDATRKVSFVANVSHELKTPLTTIRMFSELMQSGRVSSEEKRINYLATITKESQRLTRLVNNVLDFNRIDRGQRTIEATQQELNSVLEEYLEIRRSDLEQAGMSLKSALPDQPIQAIFDRDALCQILGNLIDNAIKYARSGGLLRIHVSETASHASIAIADNGLGLPPALRKKRFKAFVRGDDSLTTEASGFGLGLSISQTLAETMGGQLRYRHPRSRDESPRFIITLKK